MKLMSDCAIISFGLLSISFVFVAHSLCECFCCVDVSTPPKPLSLLCCLTAGMLVNEFEVHPLELGYVSPPSTLDHRMIVSIILHQDPALHGSRSVQFSLHLLKYCHNSSVPVPTVGRDRGSRPALFRSRLHLPDWEGRGKLSAPLVDGTAEFRCCTIETRGQTDAAFFT